MFKIIFFLAALALAAGKPSVAPAALVAPASLVAAPAQLVAAPAPFVTASSSQYISRNYNGIYAAAPLIAAPVVGHAPLVAPAAKFVAPSAPLIAAPGPVYAPGPAFAYARYAEPIVAPAPYYY